MDVLPTPFLSQYSQHGNVSHNLYKSSLCFQKISDQNSLCAAHLFLSLTTQTGTGYVYVLQMQYKVVDRGHNSNGYLWIQL